jgi:putative PIN family toxin of toxin-antitoxin system
MRLVIDTNIVASAAFFGGLPEQLVNLVLDEKITAVVSQVIVEEYEKTILKLLNKYDTPSSRLHFPFSALVAHFDFVTPVIRIKACTDPDDDKFIECALDGLCPFIVSGDHHLLDVKQYGHIKILKIRDFFENYPVYR